MLDFIWYIILIYNLCYSISLYFTSKFTNTTKIQHIVATSDVRLSFQVENEVFHSRAHLSTLEREIYIEFGFKHQIVAFWLGFILWTITSSILGQFLSIMCVIFVYLGEIVYKVNLNFIMNQFIAQLPRVYKNIGVAAIMYLLNFVGARIDVI